jgi:hypothetical protein
MQHDTCLQLLQPPCIVGSAFLRPPWFMGVANIASRCHERGTQPQAVVLVVCPGTLTGCMLPTYPTTVCPYSTNLVNALRGWVS